ncbi:MAG: extensin family protein [Pseudomonadota bacterium]|nr:extensin family protein [Pseudomonadota bacterium]
MLRTLGCLVLLLLIGAAAYWFGRDYVERHPQDFPWTELKLTDPVGRFTGGKIAALGDEPAECRALLSRAGLRDLPAPAVRAGDQCGFEDGMRLRTGGPRKIAFRPEAVTSCPVAAALVLWEQHVVQPAAERHFGSRVAAMDNLGSYSCRRIYGRSEGRYSEHSTADAIDIAGFRLEDGRRVSVLRDWEGDGASAAFLMEVRDGACGLYATVLSPDYNAAHADHLHLDQAERGAMGMSLCR